MLEYLRNAADKPVAKILMGILIFSFVGWGVADWLFGGTSRESVLITVGSTNITTQDFMVERGREVSKLSRDQQKRIYTDNEYANEFFSGILTNMLNDTMVENRAADLGFDVSKKRIAREIQDFSEFQEDGKFSTMKFDNVLMNSGLSEGEFEDMLRKQILRSYVLGGVSMPMSLPKFVVIAAYNSRYAQRKIEYTTVNYSDFKVGTPTEDQLREFYAKNPKLIPESRAVSYVLIPAAMEKPDSYDAGYKKAIELEDAIIAGESMATTAMKLKAKHIALPAFARDKHPIDPILSDSVISKIFAMDAGTESEVLETKQGFVILRIDAVNLARNAEFASVKNNLISGWGREEQKKQAYVRANELLIDLNKGNGLRGKKTATVSRASGAPLDMLGSAFANPINSNTIVPSANSFYVMRVDSEIIPTPDASKMASMHKELQYMQSREIKEDYNSFLLRKYPTKVNNKTFEKIFAK